MIKFIQRLLNEKNKFSSQSGQDQFAYNLSGNYGTYLEIGANHPQIYSNTWHLENYCHWTGISVEMDQSFRESWEQNFKRKNLILWQDAFAVDYLKVIQENNFSTRFNYLSCDIDPAPQTLKILKHLIHLKLTFDFISFEHDSYKEGNKYKDEAIFFLRDHGYKPVVDHVYPRNKKNKLFETWFVYKDIELDFCKYDEWKRKYYSLAKFYK
jgi:hypothetical protein